jgi:hypothetical protein
MLVNWIPDRDAWDRLHRASAASLQQHWAYGDAMRALGTTCLRASVLVSGDTDDTGNTGTTSEVVGLAQFLVRRIAGLVPLALCSHGPVWSASLTGAGRAEALQAIGRSVPLRRPRALLFTPDGAGAADAGMQRLRRVMTGHSTVRLDLTAAADTLRAAMNGKWRNRLVAAERSALKVARVGVKPAQYRWLLERELAQRGRRGYIALPDGFVEAYQAACGTGDEPVLTLRADLGRDAVAGMMFLVHGDAATYQVGWVGDEGRELGAHNLLLWRGILALQGRGVRSLDLGGVDTARGAGLARFKIGTGGEVVTLAGTYL